MGACRYLLEQEGLLQFFEQVFGMLGQFYGESDFDRANPEPSALEGSSDSELRESKANLIRNLMSGESLAIDEACLVEDDPQEIASVQGICRSVFVAERRGMTEGEMEELRRLALISTGAESANSNRACKEGSVKDCKSQWALEAHPQQVNKMKMPEGSEGPDCEAVSEEAASTSSISISNVKHVYLDFDQTICVVHVFKQLAGWEPGVDPPHALSERGQIHRLKMLNAASPSFGASWTARALGGRNSNMALQVDGGRIKQDHKATAKSVSVRVLLVRFILVPDYAAS